MALSTAAAIVGGSLIAGGASVLASKSQSKTARKVGELQQRASDESVAEQRRQFDTAVELTAPRREAEQEALNQLRTALGLDGGGVDYTQFYNTPGYEFTRNEALRGIERGASARGGLVSGNTLTALQDRAAGLAGQNYLSSYLNPLQNVALGNAAGQTAQQGLNLGVNIGNTLQRGAVNRGSALMQGGNAKAQGFAGVNQALQGGLSNYLLYSMLG